jgi:hypothetical protein
MKALNKTRHVTLKYPRNAPRISRKRVWMDRSEWRKDPAEVAGASTELIEQQMQSARNIGSLESTPYEDLSDMMNRAGRVGIRRF